MVVVVGWFLMFEIVYMFIVVFDEFVFNFLIVICLYVRFGCIFLFKYGIWYVFIDVYIVSYCSYLVLGVVIILFVEIVNNG